jgi:pyridoxal 5'-phosphate synthase pdxS subunit
MMQLEPKRFSSVRNFKSEDPRRAGAGYRTCDNLLHNPEKVAEVSAGLGEAMHGLDIAEIPEAERLAKRGW